MEDRPLVSALDSKTPSTSSPFLPIIISIVVVILGIGSGVYFANKTLPEKSSNTSEKSAVSTPLSTGEEGSTNPAFKDTATGQVASGGLGGEGTHHLVRPGGDSQTVYLVSSIVDLDKYVGKKVQVTGQTLKARKVGWLMDVGRVKLVE